MTESITSLLCRVRSIRTTVPEPGDRVDNRQSSSGQTATTMSPWAVNPWATKSY